MKGELALNVNGIIYKIDDKIALKLYDKDELAEGTISDIFKSVHSPYGIHINLKELPIHISIGIEEIECIYKVY